MHTIEFDGGTVPALGLGTYGLSGEVCERIVAHALEVGYRHIDTAQIYRNEQSIGRGVAASGVERDEVFVTTKVWRSAGSRDDVHRTTRESLDRLGFEYVDLLLIHWPAERVAPMEETLEALTEVRDAGLTRHIGVSNFPATMLQRAFEVAPIVTDQVEHNPFVPVDEIRQVLREHGAFLTAYSPLALGAVASDPVLTAIGAAHGVSAAQVTLRWLLQHGDTAAIPKSRDPERVRDNFTVDGFELSRDEIDRIDGLARG